MEGMQEGLNRPSLALFLSIHPPQLRQKKLDVFSGKRQKTAANVAGKKGGGKEGGLVIQRITVVAFVFTAESQQRPDIGADRERPVENQKTRIQKDEEEARTFKQKVRKAGGQVRWFGCWKFLGASWETLEHAMR